LKQFETGEAIWTQSYQFAIHNSSPWNTFQCFGYMGKFPIEDLSASREEGSGGKVILFDSLQAIPVELDFLCNARHYVAQRMLC
jgi:hypothetical protein